MSRYTVIFCHRPSLGENINSRHFDFLENSSNVMSRFGINIELIDKPAGIEQGGLLAITQLKRVLPKGMNGRIVYNLRDSLNLYDKGSSDDRFLIEFNSTNKNLDYRFLVNEFFPKIVVAFDCYRAAIVLDALLIKDYDNVYELALQGKDDGRDIIYRINPVNFYDAELCRRAFDLTPQQIYDRLNGKIEHVSLLGDGVFIVYSSEILDDAEFEQVDGKIRALLQI